MRTGRTFAHSHELCDVHWLSIPTKYWTLSSNLGQWRKLVGCVERWLITDVLAGLSRAMYWKTRLCSNNYGLQELIEKVALWCFFAQRVRETGYPAQGGNPKCFQPNRTKWLTWINSYHHQSSSNPSELFAIHCLRRHSRPSSAVWFGLPKTIWSTFCLFHDGLTMFCPTIFMLLQNEATELTVSAIGSNRRNVKVEWLGSANSYWYPTDYVPE